MRIDSRHGIKRLAAKCVAVCSMQARVHDFSGRQLAPRLVCVINAIQIQRMQIVEGSNELVAPTGISGLVLARYSMTDSPLSSPPIPFTVSNSIHHHHFLPRSDKPCALKSAISAGSIPDIWFRGRPISCVYGNLSPAFPSLLDFIPILFQLDALKSFRTLSRLYTGVR